MYLEYYINTIDENDTDIKKNIQDLLDLTSVRSVMSLAHQAKMIKRFYPTLFVGVFVDYPISNIEFSRRQDLINDAMKNNIDCVAITIPHSLIINRKYDKFRDDIKKNIDLANKMEIRYILEYRKFDHQLLAKTCDILLSCGIKIIYPSSGFFVDSLEDNMLACSYLNKKTSISTIINGNAWNKDHINKVQNSKLYGFSCNSINTLRLL